MARAKWDGRVCKRGFPIQTCSRCGGSGSYSYCTMYGDRCFKCSGTGVVHTARAARAYADWQDALRRQCRPTVADLAVGDVVRQSKGDAWRTVTGLEQTDRWAGKSLVDGQQVVTAWFMVVSFDDGSTDTWSGCLLVERQGTVDKAPFLAAAGVTGQAKLTV